MGFNKKAIIKLEPEEDERIFAIAISLIAFLLGVVVRFQFISGTEFPINDGGLFYRMTDDLLKNNLVLPQYTTYNQALLPFAYPPLGFYLTALLKSYSSFSLISLLRFIPLIVSILTLPAFYLLAKELLQERLMAGLSLLFFALVPRAFEWFLMGGGITRAMGFLFAILSMASIWRLYGDNGTWFTVTRVIIFSSLTVLSHPETALYVVYSAIIFLLYKGISKEKIIKSVLVAVFVLLIISPWLYSVIEYHGLNPFIDGSSTGQKLWFEIKNLVTLKFGFENGEFLTIYSVFALVAVITRRDKLTYTLFGMLVLGYVLFPRSGPNLLTIQVSLLAAVGFVELLQSTTGEVKKERGLYRNLVNYPKNKWILMFMMVYLFFGAFSYKYVYGKGQLHLTNEITETFSWIEDNTDPDDLFLIYPSTMDDRFWWNDYLAEWFPALTDRISVTTVQGYEWVPEEFSQRIISYGHLRDCEEIGPICIDKWEEMNQAYVDYLIFDLADGRPDFQNSFENDSRYKLLFIGQRLAVFQKNN